MKFNNRFTLGLVLALSMLGAVGCASSIKKAEIAPTANPVEEIAQVDEGIARGYDGHFDVLAEGDFKRSINYLEDAKEGVRDGDKQKEILNDLAYSKAYLERAKNTANSRQVKAQGVLDARKAAIVAGVRNYPELVEELADTDDDLRDDVDDLDHDLSLKEYSSIQKEYQALELSAIQSGQIGQARAMVNGAKDTGANGNVPNALKAAEIDLKNAENTLAANRHNPEVYKPVVEKSTQSAQYLVDVLAASKREGKDLKEVDAAKIVLQDYEIKRLKGQVGIAQSNANSLGKKLTAADQQLTQANQAVNIQKALEEARVQFDADEAEAYQQGNQLLIRLKTVAFTSGRSDLPAASLGILSKVNTIANSLNPSAISVEGHTDSVGKAQLNQVLSEKRASAVAEYLRTNGTEAEKIDFVGHGFKKPIASNKSAEGRAQNRRVDVIITPGAATEVKALQ